MAFCFNNLTNEIRQLMVDEVNYDVNNNNLYISDRLTSEGKKIYCQLLLKNIREGNEESFASSLSGYFNSHYRRKNSSGGYVLVNMPRNAPLTLAEGEFNRFYIRALRKFAIYNNKKIRVYRAKTVSNPRIESEEKIGQILDANCLLNDLRQNVGIDTFLGLPSVNSGLSIEIINF